MAFLILCERGRYPVEPFVEAIPCRRGTRLYEPLAAAYLIETEHFYELGGWRRVCKVLFVREDEQHRSIELSLGEQPANLASRLLDSGTIVRVDDKDDGARLCVVVSPQRPNLVLPSDVPYRQADVLALESLDVETDRWNRGHLYRGLRALILTFCANPYELNMLHSFVASLSLSRIIQSIILINVQHSCIAASPSLSL